MIFPAQNIEYAAKILQKLRARGLTIGTVESCTGGLLAGVLTEVAGSSDVVMGGLITYSNTLKTKLAHVPEAVLVLHGAVSEAVAIAMARGGQQALGVDVCVAITGIAGPSGGSDEKPVGRVHIAVAHGGEIAHQRFDFGNIGRAQVRGQAVHNAIRLIVRAQF